MPDSIQQLENRLHEKKKELDSLGNKLAGAGIGAALTRGLAIGAAAGALLGREKAKKADLEREVAAIERQIQSNRNEISKLETKRSQIQNDFHNNKARYEADMRQKRNDLERSKFDEQDEGKRRMIERELSEFQGKVNDQERQDEAKVNSLLDDIQRQIDRLTF